MEDNFQEEFFDPVSLEQQASQNAVLKKYYDEVFSALLDLQQSSANPEIQPYEVTVFSDSPGVLRAK